ncbi:hypothetical protein LR68_02717 [Anoxybacillus sp. BCO1]|nr:hypothetical protein LR68_02717 [Anoxybacillus sp. BCO1]
MGAPQKSKVKKIQTSYVIQQEKQEHKKARRRKKIVIRFSFVATIALAASSLFLYTMMTQSSAIDEQIKTKEQLEEKLRTLQKDEKKIKRRDQKIKMMINILPNWRENNIFCRKKEKLFSSLLMSKRDRQKAY